MASKNNIYVVQMHFMLNTRRSYVHGAYNKKAEAIKEAEAERLHRGGTKYLPEITEFGPNGRKVILKPEFQH